MTRLIDADALFINLDGMMEVSPTGYIHGDTVADMISDATTVDAEPLKHGKWIPWKYHNGFRCEFCNEPVENKHNYCPNCGARMDAERREK